MEILHAYRIKGEETEQVTFIKSGFDEAWIVVMESPNYNLDISYATPQERYSLALLLKGKEPDHA